MFLTNSISINELSQQELQQIHNNVRQNQNHRNEKLY